MRTIVNLNIYNSHTNETNMMSTDDKKYKVIMHEIGLSRVYVGILIEIHQKTTIFNVIR